jgi:TolB-like protein/Tfp pilus assembly protein PilF
MAKGKRFLLPVCIDDTREKGAQVPESFLEVQWTRLPDGEPTPQFVELVRRIVSPAGPSVTRTGERVTESAPAAPMLATKQGGLGRWIGIGLGGAIAVGALVVFTRKDPPPMTAVTAATPAPVNVAAPTKAAPQANEKSVAVLAFENVGSDKENEIFATGVPEEILTQLGRVAGLRLAGANSSFTLRGRPEAEVARKLNVTHVVSGSVQRVGAQVKITARLVNATDGTQLWAERFTEDMKNIFAAQEKIAALIAEKLSLRLSGTSRAAQSIDPEAQRLVMEARHHWNQRNMEGFKRAEVAFSKAIALAPDFAEAHAGLAGVCVVRANYSWVEGQGIINVDIARAREEANVALRLDPSFSEAHAALGFVHLLARDFSQSEQAFQRAIVANANSALTRSWYALLLFCTGRFEDAYQQYERAAEIDPLWFINLQIWGNLILSSGDPLKALAMYERAANLRTEPYIPNLGYQAMAHFRAGHTEAALRLAREVRGLATLSPRWQADAYAIYILYQAGHTQEAESYAREILPRYPADSYVRSYVALALGKPEQAWSFLSQAPTTQLGLMAVEPMFAPLRDDPRLAELAARLNISAELKAAREAYNRLQRESPRNK